MKLKKFIKEFDGAPLDLYEFAEHASLVEDDKLLSESAAEFLEAQTRFVLALEAVGVEMG